MLPKDDAEHAVPLELHATFHDIADALAAGDYFLRDHVVDGVRTIDRSTAEAIAENVSAYGDSLAPLHPSTWDYAVCRWMGDASKSPFGNHG